PKTNIYSDYLKNRELDSLTRDLNATRARAVSEGKTYSFRVVDGGKGYTIQNYQSGTGRRVNLEYTRILTSSQKRFYFTTRGSFSAPRTLSIRDYNNNIYEFSIGVGTVKITLVKDSI